MSETRLLHTEGARIYNELGEQVHLHGVCFNNFTDSSTGWFPGQPFNTWDEAAVRANLEALRSWGCNLITTFSFWNWLAYNAHDSTEGVGVTDIGCLDAYKRLCALAQEYGIYVAVGVWALYPPGMTSNELARWAINNKIEFVERWLNISRELRQYPNVIYGHPTEVSLSESEMNSYFNAVVAAVQAIRADGDEHIFLYHEDYCEYPIRMNPATGEAYRKLHEHATNIVYDPHIYRWHGTFGGNPDVFDPASAKTRNSDGVWREEDIKVALTHWGYRKILDDYKVPMIMWEGGPANYPGAITAPNTYKKELDCYSNVLKVLNEWGISWGAFWWRAPGTTGSTFAGPLATLFTSNDWGQIIIDAIATLPSPTPPPPVELSPLHSESRYIKDELGNVVLLRGVWKAEFIDDCTGWWAPSGSPMTAGAGHWDEAAVRAHLQVMKNWGCNTMATFIWANWWIDNASVTLPGYTADRPYRECIKDTIRIAEEYGIYVQLRMWSPLSTEGRVEFPIPAGAYTHNGSVFPNADAFIAFWADLAEELRGYPNVIFCIYDEPAIADRSIWFDLARRTIEAIRARGIEHLIIPHWRYCESCLWIEDWITQGLPTHNILFSNHIYRYHGTFENNANSPTDVDYIKEQLAGKDGLKRAYKYILDTYNVPIQVTIGAHNGATDFAEYNAFRNSLSVLNEWGIGYWAYQFYRSDWVWAIQEHTNCVQPPNRVGQALIDAIAGEITPPPPIPLWKILTVIAGVSVPATTGLLYKPKRRG